MNFEDCKKIMIQYLEAKEAMKQLMIKCATCCEEQYCHCNECPMFIDEQCKFGE